MSPGLVSLYSDVHAVPIRWLWYPYIPIGKITLLQGDPGDGKSTMIMNIIAKLTTGGSTPDGICFGKPGRAIYQCSEDNAADTIKPRLLQSGADCSKVAFLDEECIGAITLDDERLLEAIKQFRPSLLVIDPIQAYLGNDTDLQIVGKARKLMQRLSMWATTYDCAVILIGHLNKKEGQKSLYRGLGSIDIAATARSVLQIERDPEQQTLRHVTQVKNNLGPFGQTLHFEMNPQTGFTWVACEKEALVNSSDYDEEIIDISAREKAVNIIKQCLQSEDAFAEEIRGRLMQAGISRRMVDRVKEELGIRSYRKMRKWYWSLAPQPDKKNMNSNKENQHE